MWNEAIMACFGILTQHFPGVCEENTKTSEGIAISEPKFKIWISKL
jgi:hypothetical protein